MIAHRVRAAVFGAAVAAMAAGLATGAGATTIRLDLTAYFAWQAAPAHATYFNGRLLTANDLDDEQSYSRSSERYLGTLPDPLAAVFEPVGRADIVLLFDEADALFGKRTDVMDAHDRYADDFILLDIPRGTWRGRLYLAGSDDTAEGVYDDLFGTFEMLVPVPAPASLPAALSGLAAVGLAVSGAAAPRRRPRPMPAAAAR